MDESLSRCEYTGSALLAAAEVLAPPGSWRTDGLWKGWNEAPREDGLGEDGLVESGLSEGAGADGLTAGIDGVNVRPVE